jgi:hypothetical protein
LFPPASPDTAFSRHLMRSHRTMQAFLECHEVKRIDEKGEESYRIFASSAALAEAVSSVTQEPWVADAPCKEAACRSTQAQDSTVADAGPSRHGTARVQPGK